MLKFALSGSHGTGKSTLLKQTSEQLSVSWRVHIVNEAARAIIDALDDDKYFQRGNNNLYRQALILAEHLAEEQIQAQNVPDVLITDRTLVDHLAYTEVLFPDAVTTSEFHILKRIAYNSLSTYERVFFIPIEFSLEEDGVRENDEDFRKEIDRAIRRLYEEASKNVQQVGGSPTSRLEEVSNEIVAALGRQHRQ